MAIITDNSSFFNFVQGIDWTGQYSASLGTQDMQSNIAIQTVSTVGYISYAKLTHGFNTYFKMQGYNSNTQSYEVWFSTEKPLLIPPSGNNLSNIQVVLTWIDR